MESEKKGFVKAILFINKLIIKLLICVLTVCLLLACGNLISIVYQRLTTPPFLSFEIPILFSAFSLILIIAIGYELVKSLLIIVTVQTIPSFPIIQIAIIAVANKIITLDIKNTAPAILFGLAALITGLGATYFFHKIRSPESKENDQ